MNIDLKKSLFVSLTALGFLAVGTIGSQPAFAKSRVRVTSNSALKTAGSSRNVTFTGKNALYNKAATLKSARKVASTSTLRSIANSGRSSQNVRAYRVAKTNRGLVYYKVVTFDGQHRGWIYGGRSKTSFRGGLKPYTTFNKGAVSSDMQNGTYKLANPGTTSATYVKPAMTQYKVGKKVADTSAYADSVYKIDEAGTRTKEGDQWVHIYAYEGNAGANGWVLYSQLKTADSANNGNNSQPTTDKIGDNVLRINFVDAATGMPVKSMDYVKNGGTKGSTLGTLTNGVWQLSANDQTAIQAQMNTTLNALGYYPGALTTDQMASLAQGTLGSSVTISIQKGTKPIVDKAVRIQLTDPNGNLIKNVDYTNATAANGKTLGTANGSSWTLAATDVTAIQDQIVKALKGTGYGLNDDNKLTTDQQTALAQTVFGGQVKIQTVIPKAPDIGDNEIKISFVDTDGNALGSFKVTKVSGDDKPLSAIETATNGIDPTDGTQLTKSYAALIKAAKIKGYYGVDGLTQDQKDSNTQAIQSAAFGKEVKLTVKKLDTKPLLSSVSFADDADGNRSAIPYLANANGDSGNADTFSNALAKDSYLNAPLNVSINADDLDAALNDQGLKTIYYATKNTGWQSKLTSDNFESGGKLKYDSLKNSTIYVYKISIEVAKGSNNVLDGKYKPLGNKYLFDSNGESVIKDEPASLVTLIYKGGTKHQYTLSQGADAYNAANLEKVYNDVTPDK